MEQYRTKLGITFAAVFLLGSILFNWYSNFDKVEVTQKDTKILLTRDEKIAKYGPINVDTYDMYFVRTEVIERKKTGVPFFYDTKVLKTADSELRRDGQGKK